MNQMGKGKTLLEKKITWQLRSLSYHIAFEHIRTIEFLHVNESLHLHKIKILFEIMGFHDKKSIKIALVI